MPEPFDTYKKFRNKISDLSFEDSFGAMWAFSQYTQIKGFAFPREVEKHQNFTPDGLHQPYCWQLETVVREVVLNSSPGNRRGKSLKRWADLAEVVNALRDLEDAIHQLTLNQHNVLLETLRIAHQQFPWQSRVTTRLIGRYFQVFSTPEIDAICEKLTGLTVRKIYAIGSAAWGILNSNAFIKLPMKSTIKGISDDDLVAFFKLFSKEVYALRSKIKEQHEVDDTYAYDNRAIRAHPLIALRHGGQDFVACPLPTLLFWRFTSGLYYDLVAESDFFNEFGASFQKYVGEVLSRSLKGTKLTFLAEEKYRTKGKTKDTIDWLVLDGEAAVFVECKTKRLSLDAKTKLVSQDALLKDISILADAVVQVYKTISEYQAGKYPSLPFNEALQVHPMVVTLENWYPLGDPIGTELAKSVRDKLTSAGLSPDLVQKMPYTIASAEEFEIAAQIMAKVGCAKFFSQRGAQEYEGWMLDGYMSHAFKAERNEVLNLFNDAYDEILKPFK